MSSSLGPRNQTRNSPGLRHRLLDEINEDGADGSDPLVRDKVIIQRKIKDEVTRELHGYPDRNL